MQYVKAIKVMVTYGYGDPFLFDVAVLGKMLDGPTKKKNGVQYVKAIEGLVACECAGELFLFDAACQGKKLVGPTSDISQCIAFKHCLAVQSGSSSKVHFSAPSGELMVLNFDACVQRLFVQPLPDPSRLGSCFGAQSSEELIVITGMVERALTLVNVTLCHKGFTRLGPIQRQSHRNSQILQRSTPWMRPSVPFYCKHSLSRSRLARSWAPLTRV